MTKKQNNLELIDISKELIDFIKAHKKLENHFNNIISELENLTDLELSKMEVDIKRNPIVQLIKKGWIRRKYVNPENPICSMRLKLIKDGTFFCCLRGNGHPPIGEKLDLQDFFTYALIIKKHLGPA